MPAENSIYLRPALGFTPKEKRNNLVAFSPDILPLYQTKITDADQLTSTYDTFVAQSVVPEESNLVYVRGAVADPLFAAHANVNLFTVTNELVLWPQVLKEAAAVGSISLDYKPPSKPVMAQGLTASIKSISLKPAGQGGRHDAIISAIGLTAFTGIADAKNITDLLAIVDSNPALAFYNAIVADPVFDVYNFTTRLRFFDDSTKLTQVELDIESSGMPTGYDVSIFSSDPAINMARTHIVTGHRVGTTISVKNGFDALITVQVYKGKDSTLPPNYASISLVASVVHTSSRIQTIQVIGAEHVLFDSFPLRLSKGVVNTQQLGDTVVGFYFRDNIGDTDVIPRTGNASHSPDIQPLGTKPVPNVASTLSTGAYGTDVSDQEGIKIVANASNYIYLRGNTTQAAHIETSLYAVPNSLLIFREMYDKFAIQDVDQLGNPILATREVIATESGPLTVDTPFNWFNPPPVQAADPSSDHYCLIAEARLWTPDPQDRPLWPHQIPIPPGTDFTSWVLGTPTVACRNVEWVSNPNAPTFEYQSNITIPDGYPANTQWSLQVQCIRMPKGGFYAMSATGPNNLDLSVGQTPITHPNGNIGVNFTVVKPFSSTVTISWWQGSGPARPAGSMLIPALQINVGGPNALSKVPGVAAKAGPETENQPLFVGPDESNLLESVPEYHDSKNVKGKNLLGKAHPIQPIPKAGT